MSQSNIIRLYTDTKKTSHYTGIILKDGRVLQVKPLGDKNHKRVFPNQEAWMKEVPHEKSHIIFSEETTEWKYNPHQKNSMTNVSSNWSNYLYDIIMEANPNLKNAEGLRKTYNRLVDVLQNHAAIYFTVYPCQHHWYNHVLMINGETSWKDLPIRFNEHVHTPPVDDSILQEVYNAYKPLYDLMDWYGILDYVKNKRISINESRKQELDELMVEIKKTERSIENQNDSLRRLGDHLEAFKEDREKLDSAIKEMEKATEEHQNELKRANTRLTRYYYMMQQLKK